MASNLPCALRCYFTQIIVGIVVTVVVGLSARFVPFDVLKENNVFLVVFFVFIFQFALIG
ncbi:hypothetical protein SAMN04488121_102456 [Chitinophaga filiformis]|uniref:Uncharacterized protein n=1 Tax=Chitinophaga filiformis TaxID=104663 RepID=A0A1G7MKX5_CHIFI|nr:hypothetical protein SAMN04488121_102456 [Chitinophaga filiformis]